MITLIKNIQELLQVRQTSISKVSGAEMAELPTIKNAFLVIKDDLIADFGSMENLPEIKADSIINASGRVVLPAWCDSHTHIVYAGNREQEFVDRINGFTYEEIANRGGGILNSAKKLNETSEEEIYEQSKIRLEEVMRLGTGAVEIKSGYGLTVEGELKMLRVIKKLAENYPISIKATFLGAHAFPTHYKENKAGYIDEIITKMLPEIAQNKLADYVDVFCESGYFSVEETEKIMQAGIDFGLKPKIHVNQFNSIGGIQSGVKFNALSVDHLEIMNPEDIEALKGTETMPVALPSCSYFLSIPYTPAREMIKAGLPLALATDFNPGSTPSGNMNFVVATACIKMKMTPEEAINAATINGAYAMGLSETHGSITKGKKANLIITKPISSYYQIPYAFGSNLIEDVLIDGQII
ncbi:imidazolonepropionase [Flavobacterium johnsoniae]|uniref:Imidazolonepropionase n=1 Tax=Flavobacterium johnsoniae (strain ATCC 17061 / DSM 2064 / JCM 8514 / BCRC 14874 / CCUG 350202 / NBRC 14942 / NCIMB 11054 / UW101) TaxID=376686 RepID=HUTI_FLAJ1|nr:imidazolonepropionase [Flavobacterium johnsoniae]A5FB49.1 RecName: Full=Imidazolonepropionase; AltName: Full=Imidazolone-5-propionate hydrolase [Flavobacterium johnsoniae UW101]ABQ07569.1 imidazolonepropionase [Flavobacterium johnsoniae UW101]OXE99467.1 imidazolonepropionase [Flavobacterium johnsoniae UW101]WQG80592.1 imidazolonepropionase [Flavobacterium johnsoniae UW101]SHL08929.1 imidazolonepropionase [Flavobacterium johnsoniae]